MPDAHKFSKLIKAPAHHVWRVLWDEPSYQQWSSVLGDGSYTVSDWKKGSKIHFLTTTGDGIYAVIEEKIPGKYMAFRHLGLIKNKVEQPASSMQPLESYALSQEGDFTRLLIGIESEPARADFFLTSFPKALNEIAMLAEKFRPVSLQVETLLPLMPSIVWKYWTLPEHITQWYFASADWCVPEAVNDLRLGGNFRIRMEAKDGSFGFDLQGVYTDIVPFQRIEYLLEDGRKVITLFENKAGKTHLIQLFDAENVYASDLQKSGWQSILDNFKSYVMKKTVLG